MSSQALDKATPSKPMLRKIAGAAGMIEIGCLLVAAPTVKIASAYAQTLKLIPGLSVLEIHRLCQYIDATYHTIRVQKKKKTPNGRPTHGIDADISARSLTHTCAQCNLSNFDQQWMVESRGAQREEDNGRHRNDSEGLHIVRRQQYKLENFFFQDCILTTKESTLYSS